MGTPLMLKLQRKRNGILYDDIFQKK